MYETLKFTEMTTRRVIDAKDKDGEKVYVKGHAKATYMSDGRTVEDAIKQIGTGGGGGITKESDPVFSASPAATITEDDISGWNSDHTIVEDLTVDVAQLINDVKDKQDAISDLDTIRSGAAKGATAVQQGDIENVARLDEEYVVANGIVSNEDVYYHLPGINPDDTAHTLATKDDVSLAVETYIADFTMGSLREGMNNGSDVNCDMQALVAAMNANKIILVRDDADSSYKGVYVLNGYAEDLLYFSIVDTAGNVLYCDGTDYVYTKSYINGQTLFYRNWFDKQDTLVSGENIKTINGESIVGSGNITIAGGSGEKGDKGDTGVGVQSVKQTTTSNVDSGYNVVTVTLTDGTTSTFSVKNGSKGSTGANGTNGVSVSSVKQTTISSADGGTNVVTVTLSNGTTSTFNVKNGSKGSNGTNGKDGADGDDGATFTPSVDSAGNLSWSNNKGLANPPTVNIKGPKGDKGDAGEGGGGSSGGGVPVIAVTIHQGELSFSEHTIPLEPDKIYYANESTEMVYIFVVTPPTGDVGKYSVHFTTTSMVLGFECPQNWLWANGTTPTLESSTTYELSVVATKFGNDYIYKAVLTPFKSLS